MFSPIKLAEWSFLHNYSNYIILAFQGVRLVNFVQVLYFVIGKIIDEVWIFYFRRIIFMIHLDALALILPLSLALTINLLPLDSLAPALAATHIFIAALGLVDGVDVLQGGENILFLFEWFLVGVAMKSYACVSLFGGVAHEIILVVGGDGVHWVFIFEDAEIRENCQGLHLVAVFQLCRSIIPSKRCREAPTYTTVKPPIGAPMPLFRPICICFMITFVLARFLSATTG